MLKYTEFSPKFRGKNLKGDYTVGKIFQGIFRANINTFLDYDFIQFL